MRKWFLLFFAFLLVIPTWWVIAQDSPVIEVTGANANDLPSILINASVLDSSNRPILDLSPADFVLGGDLAGLAEVVRVENITDDSLPFAVVLVIDTSTSMSGLPLQQAKEAASLFVESISDHDPVAIVSFDSDARLVQDYTTDKAVLLAAIDGLYVRGRTALYDAAVLGAEVADAAPVPRRAVILLSDGAEYGGESVNGRAAGLAKALELGVSMYTVGLGYGIDRSYLQELSSGTNARNYESPDPSQLQGIYAELAALFRTQYILTLESTIAGDGTIYNFTLLANTPNGPSNAAVGSFRAPIPVPIVSFAEGTFAEPISSVSSITPIVAADQEIASISATVNGEAVEIVDGAVLIDPATLPPASYSLVVTATDVDGDSGSAEASFETAPLPPTVSISGLPDGAVTEPVTVTVDIVSQTAVSSVSGTVGEISLASSDDSGTSLVLDPLAFPAGDYELAVTVENEGGASTTATAPFSVGPVAPRNLRIEGIEGAISESTTVNVVADVQSGASIGAVSISADGQPLENNLIDPINFPAGELTLEATVLDSNGQSASAELVVTIDSVAPRVTIGEIPSPVEGSATVSVEIAAQTAAITASYNFDNGIDSEIVDGAILIDGAVLGNGEHSLIITVTDENGQTTTETATFVVTLPPTATPTPNLTQTAEAEANTLLTQAAETAQAEENARLQETLDANATRVFNDEATRNAQSTSDAASVVETEESTEEATEAASEEATSEQTEEAAAVEPSVAPTDAPTDEPTIAPTDAPTDEPTVVPTDAPTETATIEPTSTSTVAATLTPIGEIVEVDAQSAPPIEGNLTILLIVCGGGLLLLVFLAIVFFGRQRRRS